MEKKRFSIFRWVMLGLAILCNGFILFYSCLDSETTSKWNSAITKIYTDIVNGITHKEKEYVPLKGYELRFSTNEEYVYNNIPGYQDNCIPLGSAKEIRSIYSPSHASNQETTYTVTPADAININQNGNLLSVVGLKTGEVSITATTKEGNYSSTVSLTIVDVQPPKNVSITLENNVIPLGSYEELKFEYSDNTTQ